MTYLLCDAAKAGSVAFNVNCQKGGDPVSTRRKSSVAVTWIIALGEIHAA